MNGLTFFLKWSRSEHLTCPGSDIYFELLKTAALDVQPVAGRRSESSQKEKTNYASSSNGAVPSTSPAHAATSTLSCSRQPLSIYIMWPLSVLVSPKKKKLTFFLKWSRSKHLTCPRGDIHFELLKTAALDVQPVATQRLLVYKRRKKLPFFLKWSRPEHLPCPRRDIHFELL